MKQIDDVLDETERKTKIVESHQIAGKLLVSQEGELIQVSTVTLPEVACLDAIRKRYDKRKVVNADRPPKLESENVICEDETNHVVIIPADFMLGDISQVIFIQNKHGVAKTLLDNL